MARARARARRRTPSPASRPRTSARRADTIFPLLHVDPRRSRCPQRVVLAGLTGRVAADGAADARRRPRLLGPGSLAVQGLWPVLWGRVAARRHRRRRDTKSRSRAGRCGNLAVEGPRPAFRVGEQPYGLLPTSSFNAWVDAPGDPLAGIEDAHPRVGASLARGAAAAARAARGARRTARTRAACSTSLGVHAPSRYWQARAIADLYDLQALRAMFGMPPLDTSMGRQHRARAARRADAARADRARAWRRADSGTAARRGGGRRDCCGACRTMEPEPLLRARDDRSSDSSAICCASRCIAARAIIGEAVMRLRAGTADRARPAAAVGRRRRRTATRSFRGTNQAVAELRDGADPNGRVVAERFKEVQEALQVIADLWEPMSEPLFRGVLAALDTAAFRVDPWLTGIAERRLQRMIADRRAVPARRLRLGRRAGAVHGVGRRTARARPDARRPAARAVARAGADRGAAARCRGSLSRATTAGT